MMKVAQHGGGLQTRVVEAYDADLLGSPFKVVILNAVRELFDAETGAVEETIIPDLNGLLKAVAQARIFHSRKLDGKDIRFLRQVIGWKSKKLAEMISVTPEHLSRCENGAKVLSPTSDKLLRVFVFLATLDEEQCREFKNELVEYLTDLKISAVYSVAKPLEFTFHREVCDECAVNDGLWKEPKKVA